MFDKSAFHAIGDQLHARVRETYYVVTAKTLVHEIAGDLRHGRDFANQTPAQRAAMLARKFGNDGPDTHRDWHDLCRRDLLGDLVSLSGGPIIHNAVDAFPPKGKVVELQILRPDGTAVSPDRNFLEQVAAEKWGLRYDADKRILADEITAMWGSLAEWAADLPRPASPEQVAGEVDRVLGTPDPLPVIYWLIDALNDRMLPAHTFRKRARRRWLASGRPPLHQFAPYAHYCARVQLLYLVGYDVWPKARELNDLADLEYLRLLPFVDAFAVDDRFVRAIAMRLVRPGQRILGAADLQKELAVT